MELYRKRGWVPLLLLLSEGEKIVGSVPVRVRNEFGFRFAKFLYEPHFSSDFILFEEERESCIEESLSFLFDTLNLNYVDFTLQFESPNLPVLRRVCESNGIHFYESFGNAHRVLPVKHTWEEYVGLRGKKFKEFEYLERKLGRAGSWRVASFENDEIGLDVYDSVLDIERRSWKEKWRIERGLPDDEHLPMVWDATNLTRKSTLDYNWSIYFLELNSEVISYVIVLQYKDESVILKTSYDDRYGKFAPGKFLMNVAIRDQFEDGRIRVIEFLTDLPFLGIWGPLRLPRVRMIMSCSRLLPKFVGRFSDSHFHSDFTISRIVHSLGSVQALREMAKDWREG